MGEQHSVTMIRYQFDPRAAIQAAAFFLKKGGGSMSKVKLMKLLYLADREHFLKHGWPVTGDTQSAMPHGPVPSCTLDLLGSSDEDAVVAFIDAESTSYSLKADPGTDSLPNTVLAVLEELFAKYGALHQWALRDLTHKFPEYVECNREGTSTPIPYETILKYHGRTSSVAANRPQISAEMAQHMLCPFRESDADL